MRFPRRLTPVLVLLAALSVTASLAGSAFAQGATADTPSGCGRAVQAPSETGDDSAVPATFNPTARFVFLRGSVAFGPGLVVWPSAPALARFGGSRIASPRETHRSLSGPADRQRGRVTVR